ncbi:sulfite exporter TauE/SafE family protein [Aminivibrio sp.]|uniref:sulfite exporter TauE/SafE family protein n=1 Tax=Aminivibrio sp. TaxID=1872489 RepID=UPI001A597EB7|nr:sulfite exporter TauE/SafE family protein [Aminivibrio sp.]MBL3539196.1 sulfite exporter TauE/SafE family protein [Aminivibrio sp.]
MHLPIYLLPLAGLIIGFLISLMGGGGGIFYVGMLTGLFAISMDQAVSVSLATIIPTTLAASISHYRAGNVKPKTGFLLVAGGIVGVIAGSYLVTIVPVKVLKKIFGIFLLVMGTGMVISRKEKHVKEERAENGLLEEPNANESKPVSKLFIAKGLVFGLLGGLMSGMLGASGTPPILAGLESMGLSSLEVVGTSVMVLFFIAITGMVTHSAFGTLNWLLVILLASGTITGAILGPLFSKRINKKALEKFYGPFFIVFILLMAISMFF